MIYLKKAQAESMFLWFKQRKVYVSVQFNLIPIVSVTVEVASRGFTETQSLAPEHATERLIFIKKEP